RATIVPLAPVSAYPRRIVTRWIVAGSKILRRGSIRFRLAFLYIGYFRSFAKSFCMLAAVLRAVHLFTRAGFTCVALMNMRFVEVQYLLAATPCHRQRFARQYLY